MTKELKDKIEQERLVDEIFIANCKDYGYDKGLAADAYHKGIEDTVYLLKNKASLLSNEDSGLRWVKASERFPKRDGCYAAKYLFMGAALDITGGKILHLSLPHKELFDFDIENLEWLQESTSQPKEQPLTPDEK